MGECEGVSGGTAVYRWELLKEGGSRLIKSIAAVAVAFFACLAFPGTILDMVTYPHELATSMAEVESTLTFGGYMDPIMAQLKACLFAAGVITSPWLVYQAWAFVGSRLPAKERTNALKMALPAAICLLAGVAGGYLLTIPGTLHLLERTAGLGPDSHLMVGSYLPLFFQLTLGLAVVFQVPVVISYLRRPKAGQPGTQQETQRRDEQEQMPEESIEPPRLITGDDLIERGYEPGPAFGEILSEVRESQLEGDISTRQEALDLADRVADRIGAPRKTDEDAS
ncbi:MAG: twin-arginine translocase subunit TatC [Planctomycetota bacterium]